MRSLLNQIDERDLRYADWADVDAQLLRDDQRAKFLKRKRAVTTYIDTGSMNRAMADSHLSRSEIHRLLIRCVERMEDGRLAGFRACIPFHRVQSYRPGEFSGKGTAGCLEALFSKYPSVEKETMDFVLRRKSVEELPLKMTPAVIRDFFLRQCRKAGVPTTGWPFNSERHGIDALVAWTNRLQEKHPRSYIKSKFGDDAARTYDEGLEPLKASMEEESIWEMDEYTNDTFLAIDLNEDGKDQFVPMTRCKIISVRRRGTNDVIASRVVLKKEPNANDFLKVLEAAVRPHEPVKFSVDGFRYPDGPCYASQLPGCDWLLPNVLALDNSKVHLAEDVRKACVEQLKCILFFGVVMRPLTRAHIESWHRYLSLNLLRLATGTGSGPKDPFRRDPEATAVKLRFTVDQMNQLLEMLVVEFNRSPKKTLGDITPIEAFQNWARDENRILRRMPVHERGSFSLARSHHRVKIYCPASRGHQPTVTFQHAVYRGPRLAALRDVHRRECTLVFVGGRGDFALLYGKDGTQIDTIHAIGEWREPHRLADRKAVVRIRKRKNRKGPMMGPGENSADVLREHLVVLSKTDKDAALKLAELNDAVPPSANKGSEAPAPKVSSWKKKTPSLLAKS